MKARYLRGGIGLSHGAEFNRPDFAFLLHLAGQAMNFRGHPYRSTGGGIILRPPRFRLVHDDYNFLKSVGVVRVPIYLPKNTFH